jgi:hypothetical protein
MAVMQGSPAHDRLVAEDVHVSQHGILMAWDEKVR